MGVYTDGTHVAADTLAELHAWAAKAGVKRCWFEGTRRGHPHYDLPKCRRGRPLEGVTKVSPREVLAAAKRAASCANRGAGKQSASTR